MSTGRGGGPSRRSSSSSVGNRRGAQRPSAAATSLRLHQRIAVMYSAFSCCQLRRGRGSERGGLGRGGPTPAIVGARSPGSLAPDRVLGCLAGLEAAAGSPTGGGGGELEAYEENP